MAQEISTKGPVFSQLETHTKKKKVEKIAAKIPKLNFFRSARASCTTSGGPVRTYALKILTPIYRHICLMNHQETPQTNPMAQWDPLDVSLNPLGPPAPPPIAPLGPLKRSLGLIEL